MKIKPLKKRKPLPQIILRHYKPGGLVFEIWPFNLYVRYVGRKVYRDARRVGLPNYVALYLTSFPFCILVCSPTFISGDFWGGVLNLVFLNNFWMLILINQHKKHIKDRIIFYSLKNDIYKMDRLIAKFTWAIDTGKVPPERLQGFRDDITQLTAARDKLTDIYTTYKFYHPNNADTIKRRRL